MPPETIIPGDPYPSSGGNWGSIGGTLSNQTDLQTELNAKASSSHNHDSVYEAKNANIQTHIAQAHAPSDAQKNSDITKAEIEAKLTGEITSHSHAGSSGEAFPVGAVFISVVSTNPSTLLGYGTWSAFGAGKVLVGLDSGDIDFDTVEETGGAKTHTLTESEIPSHTHVQNSHNHTQDAHNHGVTDPGHTHVENNNSATTGGLAGWAARDTSTNTPVATGYSTASATTGVTVNNATATNQAATATNQNTGGGSAHNNLQPFIVCYFWKRTV